MYKPSFNTVLVQIDDQDANWGGENNEAMLGKSYRKGTIIAIGPYRPTEGYPPYEITPAQVLAEPTEGGYIMWNEGTGAGTTFEHEGKLYGLIYWFDIRGIRE